MSAFSDYKCGAIDYDEFVSACNHEFAGDNDEPSGCEGCEFYKLQRINMFTVRRACTEDYCIKEEESEEEE